MEENNIFYINSILYFLFQIHVLILDCILPIIVPIYGESLLAYLAILCVASSRTMNCVSIWSNRGRIQLSNN